MYKHRYWINIYPTDDRCKPWRVIISETRLYRDVEDIYCRSEEEVNNKVKDYLRMYGDEVRVGEFVYHVGPNKRFNFEV